VCSPDPNPRSLASRSRGGNTNLQKKVIMTTKEKDAMWKFIMVNLDEVLEDILHEKAIRYMDDLDEIIKDKHRVDGQYECDLSLDEFLSEYHEKLTLSQYNEGMAILDAFGVVRRY